MKIIDIKHEEIEIFNVLSYEWINDFKIIQIYPYLTGQNKKSEYGSNSPSQSI